MMEDFTDIWPEWANLSGRLAFQVEHEWRVGPDVLTGLDARVAKFLLWLRLAPCLTLISTDFFL